MRWSWHHLRVLLGYVALWSLIALWYMGLGWVAILLMRLQLTREWLLVVGGCPRLWGYIPMWVRLCGLKRWVRAWNSPRDCLVALSHGLAWMLRVSLRLLLLLLWL